MARYRRDPAAEWFDTVVRRALRGQATPPPATERGGSGAVDGGAREFSAPPSRGIDMDAFIRKAAEVARGGRLLEAALRQIAGGVAMLTIHPTPTPALIRLAERRLVPWTSRGGGLVIRDLIATRSSGNAYEAILDDLVVAAARAGCVISIGASFRSANIFDCRDECQLTEIDAQLEFADYIVSRGVDVVIESPGHGRAGDLRHLASVLLKAGYPVMPLGPMPTDIGLDYDHVAAAIGATIFGLDGCASIIAAVTREEHTGGVPTLESTVEAVRSARVAAHIIDIHLLGDTWSDEKVARARAAGHTCVVGRNTPGCARCADACPL